MKINNKPYQPLTKKLFPHFLGLVLVENDTSCVLSGFEKPFTDVKITLKMFLTL